MLLPIEILSHILQDDKKRLYLLNKDCMKEYIRERIETLPYHTKFPIFNNPLFPYYSFVTTLNIHNMMYVVDLERWINFPYDKLLHCTRIKIVLFKNPLMFDILKNIALKMPGIVDTRIYNYNNMDSLSKVLKLFINTKLRYLELPVPTDDQLQAENLHMISAIKSLTSIVIGDPIKLADFTRPIPNIHFVEFPLRPFRHLNISCRQLTAIFPNINRFVMHLNFVNEQLIEIMQVVPKSIPHIEIVSYTTSFPLTQMNIQFINVAISIVHIDDSLNYSVFNLLKNHSQKWVLSIGSPCFMIISNHSNFNEIVKWYPTLFDRKSNFSVAFYNFQHFQCNGLYFHLCEPRLLKNLEFDKHHVGYKDFDTYSIMICKELDNSELVKWLETRFEKGRKALKSSERKRKWERVKNVLF